MTGSFYLEIIPQDNLPRRVSLDTGRIVIGRSPHTCDLVIPDRRVSRVHIQVKRCPDTGVTVTDLYSANGTCFDGFRLPPGLSLTWLLNQPLMIGGTRLVLRYGALDTDGTEPMAQVDSGDSGTPLVVSGAR
jgi:pSer/pThr/pTyr-binding forkhead associated (FHA) protein